MAKLLPRILSILLGVALLGAAAYHCAAITPRLKKEPQLMEGVSALSLYKTFVANLNSGEIEKTHQNTQNLLDFFAYTQEDIVFRTQGDGRRVLTYRQRQPLVFWYYPEPDYYDGVNYFYKHSGTWFVDVYNRYASNLAQDYMGIPQEFFSEQYQVVSDELFAVENGFTAKVLLESSNLPDPITGEILRPDETVEIAATLTLDLVFETVDLTRTYPFTRDKVLSTAQDIYSIRYRQVNRPVTVTCPKSLQQSEIEYLKRRAGSFGGEETAPEVLLP